MSHLNHDLNRYLDPVLTQEEHDEALLEDIKEDTKPLLALVGATIAKLIKESQGDYDNIQDEVSDYLVDEIHVQITEYENAVQEDKRKFYEKVNERIVRWTGILQ